MMLMGATLTAPRWTIPPFETGGQVFARLAYLVAPKQYQSVPDWARINTSFDLDALPWHVEIMEALGDPETAEVGLLGPSQAGKSTIGLCWLGWTIDHDQGDFLLCQPSELLTKTFMVTRVDPFIAKTSAVRKRLLQTPDANNTLLKQFQGMFVAGVWPVPGQFTQRSIRFGWVDDADQIPANIGATKTDAGQGSIVKLLHGRMTAHLGRETKFISSSPADETGGKTEAFVAGGTDERLHPVCPQCGERWEIDYRRDLRFDNTGTPEDAATSAHVVCEPSGCVLQPSDRRRLLNSLIGLPHRGFVAACPEAGRRRRSFRVDGLLCFTSWPDLARDWREAEISWSLRQDEADLRTFHNTKGGKNYRSILSGEEPLKANDLAARREPSFALGTVPRGVKVIVVLVDAQGSGFEWAAIGFGHKLESWIIDRQSIDLTDDGTPLRPFVEPRHAEVLRSLWWKTWPLADGSGQSPPALTVVIDTGGGGSKEDSWTNSAKALWHKAVSQTEDGWGIDRRRITLVKGGNKPEQTQLMKLAEFADKKIRGGAKRMSPDLWMPNVHRIKNIIDARLRKPTPGPGYIHIPGADRPGSRRRSKDEGPPGLADQYLDEITAEELKKGRWEKIRPRNETWDHLVYAYAALLKPGFAQSRDHMRWVPATFRVPDQERSIDEQQGSASGEAEGALPGRPGEPERGAAVATPAAPAAPVEVQHVVVRPAPSGGDWIGTGGESWF